MFACSQVKGNWHLAEGLHVSGTELCGVLCWCESKRTRLCKMFNSAGKRAMVASVCWHSRATCAMQHAAQGITSWAKLMKAILLWYEDLSLWPAEHVQLLVVNVSVNTLHKWPMTPLCLSWRFLTRWEKRRLFTLPSSKEFDTVHLWSVHLEMWCSRRSVVSR